MKLLEDIKKAYYRERKRILNYASARRKKGFNTDVSNLLPKIPKKITEGSIRRLRKITPEKISETETVYYGKNRTVQSRKHWLLSREYKRDISKPKKPKRTKKTQQAKEVMFRNRLDEIVNTVDDNVGNALTALVNEILFKGFTYEQLENRVEELESQGKRFDAEELYSEGRVLRYVNSLFDGFGVSLEWLQEAVEESNIYEYEATGMSW